MRNYRCGYGLDLGNLCEEAFGNLELFDRSKAAERIIC